MRAYPMLLGLALTVGYGYAAQLAVTSVGARPAEAAPARGIAERSAPGRLWYGGVLDPVTVEARGESPAKTAIARRWLLDHSGARCAQPKQRYSALL
ncbi:MAG TPA: hypothetical protein VFU41_15345 [Gemmatimonadales bacterium]|nr:hypothetical protein [Gemmatimonadales bacterium]